MSGPWRVQPRIQREAFLGPDRIGSGRGRSDENHVPAMRRYGAGDHNEAILGEQSVPECLLSGAGDSRPQPVWIWDRCRIDDVNARWRDDSHRRQGVRNRVQRSEAIVDGDLEDGRRRIDRAIHCPDPPAVPAPTCPIGTFTAVPGIPVSPLIQTPCHKLAATEWRRKWRHV